MRTWIELHKKAVYHNIEQISKFCKKPVIAVIKSDAYGHGLQEMGALYEQHPAVSSIAVAHAAEALELKGTTKPILVLAHSTNYLEELISAGVHITIYDKKIIQECVYYARKLNKPAYVHLKVDTGMNRLGLSAQDVLDIISLSLPELQCIGISTHLNDKDAEDTTYTKYQLSMFDNVRCQLPDTILTHALSSGSLEYSKQYQHSMIRVGTHLYGFWSSATSKQRLLAHDAGFSLQPIAQWKSSIVQIKQIPQGSCVGYNRTFQAPHDMTIAIIPVGYADGYPRQLSNKGYMRIKGVVVPVIGVVSMNLIALDVSNVPSITYQDEVVIYDEYYETSVERAAHICNTLQIDLTTKMHSDIKRLIV